MDLDADGQLDMLSGSWPGELFLFRGGPDRTFAAPVKLKYRDGKTINIGGAQKSDDNELLIAGDATFKEEDGKNYIIYEDQRFEMKSGMSGGITGTASAVYAADWDGDGDYDLLVGDIGGNVYLVPNEGDARTWSFGRETALEAGGKAIRVGGDAGPHAADWDGDGDLDLLVGDGQGQVSLFRNVGSPKAPELAEAVTLVAPGDVEYGPDAPREPRRGHRAKVCAVDWDGDLDLIVGDFATQKPDLPEPTPEQRAEQEVVRKELDELMGRYRELVETLYGSQQVKDAERRQKFQEEFNALSRKMSDLRQKLPPEYENHGWVWLFRRKAAVEGAGGR